MNLRRLIMDSLYDVNFWFQIPLIINKLNKPFSFCRIRGKKFFLVSWMHFRIRIYLINWKIAIVDIAPKNEKVMNFSNFFSPPSNHVECTISDDHVNGSTFYCIFIYLLQLTFFFFFSILRYGYCGGPHPSTISSTHPLLYPYRLKYSHQIQ